MPHGLRLAPKVATQVAAHCLAATQPLQHEYRRPVAGCFAEIGEHSTFIALDGRERWRVLRHLTARFAPRPIRWL